MGIFLHHYRETSEMDENLILKSRGVVALGKENSINYIDTKFADFGPNGTYKIDVDGGDFTFISS